MQTIKGKITWIDIFKPNVADVEAIKKYHAFHPVILEELVQPSTRDRVESYKTYLFIVHHIPVYDPQTKTSRRAEIDILVTKNTFVLVRYEPLEQIDTFIREVSNNATLQKQLLSGETFLPLYHVVQEIEKFSLRQLRHIEEQVHYTGQEIFSGKEETLLRQISYIKRNILDYRLITRPHEGLFASLVENGTSFWGEKAKVYLDDLLGDSLKASQRLENYFEIIESLENTNQQLLNAATNATIKRFTILAFLFTIPLFFVFLTDNGFGARIIGSAGMFWTLLSLIFIFVGVLIVVFKRKKML